MFGYVERHKKINRIHNNRRLYIYVCIRERKRKEK